jgi:hypothetical protein
MSFVKVILINESKFNQEWQKKKCLSSSFIDHHQSNHYYDFDEKSRKIFQIIWKDFEWIFKTFIKIKDSVRSKAEMIKTFENQQIYYWLWSVKELLSVSSLKTFVSIIIRVKMW